MEIEKLFVSLALDAAKYSDGLRAAQRDGAGFASRIKSSIGGGLATAAKIGTTALLGVGITLGGIAASGANAFIGFQNQMNEVFTLLPGISQEAMDDMSGQVLDFSRDFAVLPDQVVPALYQSLSAGVPSDNVFSFLETAQKAAVGGITELETAVDGITSVVNAYGSDVVGAAKASDVMFTAVRLGKTDFEQLSSSLFNVIPTAASLGVTFEDVSAQLAVMTAQGTPTSVATTQIRSAMVEASKSGTKLSDAIKDLTGKSFAELIQSGSSMPEIFEQLRQSMPEQEFKDLFGSVEAMNAALSTTGPNFEGVSSAMDEMTNAAGATDAAYEQMNGGIGRSIEQFKAFGATALIQVGDALSPIIDKVLELAQGALPVVQAGLEIVTGILGSLFSNLEEGMTPLNAFIEAIWDIAPPEFLEALVNFRDNILPGLMLTFENLWASLQPLINQVLALVSQFVSWQDVMIAVGLVIGAALVSAIVTIVSAIAPVLIAVGLVIAIISLLRNVWENDWMGIRTFIEATIPVIQEVIQNGIATVQALWQTHGAFITAYLQTVWASIQDLFQAGVNLIMSIVTTFQALFRGDWEAFGAGLVEIFTNAWALMIAAVENAFTIILPIVARLGLAIIEKLATIDWPGVGRNIISGIAAGISGAVGVLKNAITTAAQSALAAAKAALGIASPSRVAANLIGRPFTQGIAVGIESASGFIDNAIDGVLSRAVSPVGAAQLAGAGVVNNAGNTSYSSQTTVNLPSGADPMRALRASRHLDKMGRGST